MRWANLRALFMALVIVGASITAALSGTTPAYAAQPNFQIPFPCGETWRASTYSSHDAIDWNTYPDDNGRAVVASAAGTASLVYEPNYGGYMVVITHGGGWETVYAHLQQNGRVSGQVNLGQLIGFVGSSGASTAPHLHWEQKYNGVRQVPLYANGMTLSPGLTADQTAPLYTSNNCGHESDAPGDYNGDGSTDIAVFRPSTGGWHIRSVGDFTFGQSGDVLVPGDYDGNGNIEAAVFRPGTGYWHVRGGVSVQYGQAGDIPVPADYNNDGTTDIAIFRPSDGGWHVRMIADFAWGYPGDIPQVADFDGNGTVEAAVFRPNTGYWHVRGGPSVQYGQPGDEPIAADYNNDGAADIAVFRPSSGGWHVRSIADFNFGQQGDIPTVGDYDGNGVLEAAVFRPSTGYWHVRGGISVRYGELGDIPVPVINK